MIHALILVAVVALLVITGWWAIVPIFLIWLTGGQIYISYKGRKVGYVRWFKFIKVE